MLPVGLVHVQNSLAAVFASCADEKLVTVIDFSLGTIRSGYETSDRIYNVFTRYIMALVE